MVKSLSLLRFLAAERERLFNAFMVMLLLLVLILSGAKPVYAADFTPANGNLFATRAATIHNFGYSETLVNATNATTTYSDTLSITAVPVQDPNAQSYVGYEGGSGYGVPPDVFYIWWSADVSKATASTGVCAIYVNAAVYAASARTIASAAGNGTIGGVLRIANTTTGSQSIKLQCKSGDTNTFTINRASLEVQEHY